MRMKRFVNVRIPVLLAISLVAGIAAYYLFCRYDISPYYLIAVVPVAAIIFIICIFTKRSNVCLTAIVLCALFIILGALNCGLRLNDFSKNELSDTEIYKISATVSDKGENSRGEYLIVKNVKANGEKVSGKIIVYLSGDYGDFCDIGYKVNFTSKINKHELFMNGSLNYYTYDHIKYSCNVYGGLTAEYGFNLFGAVRSYIRITLFNNLDNDIAPVAFAMFTGDSQYIEDGMLESFRFGGIAHIFAISGLHIGIVYGILNFIFKKAKVNKYLITALCIIPLFLYAGVCGFTLSSVRAAIMCTVASLAKLILRKYDGLNSLAISCVIILTVNPISLFNVGFQLSVSAVAGILILKLPRKMPNSIKTPLAAQAATAPVLVANLGYVSVAGLLLNIIVIPLLSAMFVILFIGTVIAIILPFAAVLLQYLVIPLQAIVSFFVAAGFENAILTVSTGLWIPFYYLGLVAVSDKINLLPYQRFIVICLTVAAICICFIIV